LARHLAARRHQGGFDVGGDRVDLRAAHRPLVGGAGQRTAQLLGVEWLASPAALADEQRLLVALAGREPVPAGRALTAPPDRRTTVGAAALQHCGGSFAKGTIHCRQCTSRSGSKVCKARNTLHIA
jgi:hypothetical protein